LEWGEYYLVEVEVECDERLKWV